MPINPEELLWELSKLEEEGDEPIPADSTLQDFQEGRLAPRQAAQVERLLARSRQARMRLAVLAGLRPEAPSQELRSRVLASLPARRLSRLSWQRAAMAAAAMAVVALMAQLFWVNGPSPSPDFLPDYEIRVFGAAEVRGSEPALSQQGAPQQYRVGPETRVRIELSARTSSSEVADYGLYRLDGAHLERLSQGLTLKIFRAAASFEALGSDLAPQPGRWQLFALVAAQGSLPQSLSLQSGQSPEAKLREASKGQVFPLLLELLSEGGEENQKGKEEE